MEESELSKSAHKVFKVLARNPTLLRGG